MWNLVDQAVQSQLRTSESYSRHASSQLESDETHAIDTPVLLFAQTMSSCLVNPYHSINVTVIKIILDTDSAS